MKKLDGKSKLYISLIVLFLMIVIIAFTISKINTNKDKSEIDIIGKDGKIPVINLMGLDVSKINQKIQQIYKDYYQKENIKSEYKITDDILSVILTIKTNDEYGVPITKFESYNINVKDGTIFKDKDILKKFNTTEQEVKKIIETTFRYHYDREVKEGYIPPQECNYTCYLKWRGFDDYLKDVKYYIDGDKLIAYKSFYTNSIYQDINYFSDGSHQFIIK